MSSNRGERQKDVTDGYRAGWEQIWGGAERPEPNEPDAPNEPSKGLHSHPVSAYNRGPCSKP